MFTPRGGERIFVDLRDRGCGKVHREQPTVDACRLNFIVIFLRYQNKAQDFNYTDWRHVFWHECLKAMLRSTTNFVKSRDLNSNAKSGEFVRLVKNIWISLALLIGYKYSYSMQDEKITVYFTSLPNSTSS